MYLFFSHVFYDQLFKYVFIYLNIYVFVFCVNITDSCVFVEEQGMGPDNEAVHDLMHASSACLPFPTNETGVLHSDHSGGSLRVDHFFFFPGSALDQVDHCGRLHARTAWPTPASNRARASRRRANVAVAEDAPEGECF